MTSIKLRYTGMSGSLLLGDKNAIKSLQSMSPTHALLPSPLLIKLLFRLFFFFLISSFFYVVFFMHIFYLPPPAPPLFIFFLFFLYHFLYHFLFITSLCVFIYLSSRANVRRGIWRGTRVDVGVRPPGGGEESDSGAHGNQPRHHPGSWGHATPPKAHW